MKNCKADFFGVDKFRIFAGVCPSFPDAVTFVIVADSVEC